MALSAAQINKLATILRVTAIDIEAQIIWLGSRMTSTLQLDIETELTRWTTFGAKFTKLHPLDANKGVETDPERVKDDIRSNLAFLFAKPDWGKSGSVSGFEMVRG